jgi:hypothetical protein
VAQGRQSSCGGVADRRRQQRPSACRSRRDPSRSRPAAEWPVDDCHVVEAQIRQIDDDLPQGY